MTRSLRTVPNPDLVVGADHLPRWNRPAHRRHGFHNAHRLWRRMARFRAQRVLTLDAAESPDLAARPETPALTANPGFSALVCARGQKLLLERYAPDFGPRQPHAIQSVTKLNMHLIAGALIRDGLLDPARPVAHYLPWIGSGYAAAPVRTLLDMDLANDFTEDYEDPLSDCYAEEAALGWRLPPEGTPEPTLRDFTAAITGADLRNPGRAALYKSANTDVLTLIAAAVSPVPLLRLLEEIADAAGYEDAFHVSLSPEGLPALSGGGCLSTRDLARFGLLLARGGRGAAGGAVGDPAFTAGALTRPAPHLAPPRDHIRYSRHLMTDGRRIGHSGYGGELLMVDMESGAAAAYLGVLENASGYDDGFMAGLTRDLGTLLAAAGLAGQ